METRLKLVLPGEAHRIAVTEYRQEFLDHGDSMDGCARLDTKPDFAEWLREAGSRRTEAYAKETGWVPATVYLAVDQDTGELVGMVDIRHRLNDGLLAHGGHIGYSVRQSRRQMGYGTEILRLALEACRKMGLDRVLVTCSKSNAGSAKIILNNGGTLENEIHEENRITQRYWISL